MIADSEVITKRAIRKMEKMRKIEIREGESENKKLGDDMEKR